MTGHADAIRALAVALCKKSQLLHRFLVELKPHFALEEAVKARVRGYGRAVFATALAEFVCEPCERLRGLVLVDFHDGIKGRLERLPVLAVASLQVNRAFGRPEVCLEELWRCAAESSPFGVAVPHHSKLVHPHDRPQSLNVACLLVLDEVSNEKTFADLLGKSIVALSRARCRSTRSAESGSLVANDRVSARALELGEVQSRPMACVKRLV